MSVTNKPAPPIYTPDQPDELRDGLYRGFHEHMARLRAAKDAQADERE